MGATAPVFPDGLPRITSETTGRPRADRVSTGGQARGTTRRAVFRRSVSVVRSARQVAVLHRGRLVRRRQSGELVLTALKRCGRRREADAQRALEFAQRAARTRTRLRR
jgi:hypothetical protein